MVSSKKHLGSNRLSDFFLGYCATVARTPELEALLALNVLGSAGRRSRLNKTSAVCQD
jgi:hypothetical protein